LSGDLSMIDGDGGGSGDTFYNLKKYNPHCSEEMI
jgi:hypothetical protein